MIFFDFPHGLGPSKTQKLTCVCPKEVNIYTLGPTELPTWGRNGPRMPQNGPEKDFEGEKKGLFLPHKTKKPENVQKHPLFTPFFAHIFVQVVIFENRQIQSLR